MICCSVETRFRTVYTTLYAQKKGELNHQQQQQQQQRMNLSDVQARRWSDLLRRTSLGQWSQDSTSATHIPALTTQQGGSTNGGMNTGNKYIG